MSTPKIIDLVVCLGCSLIDLMFETLNQFTANDVDRYSTQPFSEASRLTYS